MAVILVGLSVVLSVESQGTSSNGAFAGNYSVSRFGNYSRYTFTWATSADTVIIPVYAAKSYTKSVTTPVVLNIYTQSAQVGTTSDSVSICVRYQVSSDNVNWASVTVGTDSTTWATRLKSTSTPENWKLTPIALAVATYFGYQPYARLYIFGKNAYYNKPGTKIRVDILEQ
jgi:hypothetical protein